VEYVADVSKLAPARLFERPVGAASPGLLESDAYLLKLSKIVGQLSPAEKVGGAGDGEVFDTEVNPENRSVLGGVSLGIVLVSAKPDI